MTTDNDAEAILLGYAHPSQARTIGFSSSPTVGIDQLTAGPTPILHHAGSGPLIVAGKTSSGKSTSVLIPACLRAPIHSTILCVDVKGEIASVAADFRRKRGATVHVIDPFGLTTDKGATLNPLDLIDPTMSPTAGDDAAVLAEAIVSDLGGHDRYWDLAARHAVAAAALLIAAHAPPKYAHLGTLADTLGAGTGPTLAALLAAGICSNVADGMVRRESENLASLAPQTLSSITGTLATHLRPLSSPLIKASMSSSSIDLDSITRGDPATIFLVMPADKIASHRACLRLWINTTVCAIARRRERPATRTLFLIDELAALGSLDAIKSLSFLLRSYGADCVIFLQAVDQLAKLYPQDWQALLDNAASILCLSDGAALQRLVRITAGDSAADSLPRLPPGHSALIRDGAVEYIQRADYRDDPSLRHLADLNPFFRKEIGHG